MDPLIIAEAEEVKQSTYVWTGDPMELALVLQRELGVTEDVVPINAKYMQLWSFDTEEDDMSFSKGPLPHCVVTFYDFKFNTVGEHANIYVENFVL